MPPGYWGQVTDALSQGGQAQGPSQQQQPFASARAGGGDRSGGGGGGGEMEGAGATVGLMQRLSLGGGRGESLLEGRYVDGMR